MEELKKNLDQAYKLLSTVYVRGDYVDVMSKIRDLLRTAYKIAEQNDHQSQKITTGSFEAKFVEEESENG